MRRIDAGRRDAPLRQRLGGPHQAVARHDDSVVGGDQVLLGAVADRPHALLQRGILDGEAGDWQGAQAEPYVFGAGNPWLQVSAGRANERLYLLIDARDRSRQRGEAHWPADLDFDRLRLRLSGPSGQLVLRLANSESGEFFQPCCPDPEIRLIAAFENERRFLPLDLLYARPVQDGMRTYLHQHGMPPEEYAWFMQQDVRGRSILGVDYYEWNEKLIDSSGHAQALGELFGWYAIAGQYYQRYRRPMMHTETNRVDAADAPRWLWRQWHNVQLMRRAGVPLVGFTWYSLTDQVDWANALAEANGRIDPSGLFDLNRDPRAVGLAYMHLIEMHRDQPEYRECPALKELLN